MPEKQPKSIRSKQQPQALAAEAPVAIRMPLMWLTMAVLVVYLPTLQFGFTDLDDTIFIRELAPYNEDINNFWVSFTRGLFHPTNDDYYRPFFSNIMLLNYQLSGTDIKGYHVVNILLHLGSTLLLFGLFQRLNVSKWQAFLLTLLFAIHPVLCSSVTWIPGRNDTLLALFVIPFVSRSIDFLRLHKPIHLIWAFVLLACALFTKETAVFAAPAAFVLVWLVVRAPIFGKQTLALFASWGAAIVFYFFMRSQATLKHGSLDPGQMAGDFFQRLPLLIQYIGKVFLPFNLSVFPTIEDTSYWLGIIAVGGLVGAIVVARNKEGRTIAGGMLFFLLMLMPALLVPNKLNTQSFEHRLYVPIIGLLLVLPQTAMFQNQLSPRRLIPIVLGVAVLFGLVNYRHQRYFEDPLTFWTQAAETSPRSAYALMMYAARIQNTDKPESYRLMREAYRYNPDEKYLNFYYGVMLQAQDSVLESERFLRKEQKISDYYECDFYLARVAITKQDTIGAEKHLQRYLTRDSMNQMANGNLLLIYLQAKDKEAARKQIETMQRRGIPLPPDVMQLYQSIP